MNLLCADHWMFTRLCRSDDNRLLTSTVNTSNEHNSCFPSQLILEAIALSLSVGVIQTSGLNIALNVSTFSDPRTRKSSQTVCVSCHSLWVRGRFVIPNIALVWLIGLV